MDGVEVFWDWTTVFGYAGLLANVIWIMMRRRSYLLLGQTVACGFMAAHFHFMGSVTGSLIMLVAGVQAMLAVPLGLYPKFKLVYLVSGGLSPLICYATWQGGSSLFSALVLLLVCVANYQLNEVRQRGLLILALLAWIGHNIIVGSLPALMSNGIAFIFSATMLYRAVRIRSLPAAGAW
ncbi:YgjV family protein [Marinobacter sp. 1-4A]|uniref:YgjV family protein n=1 Tax=Marinobacter sp. 1-4A TaxID=2582919 RepID=UPI0019046EFF|nr:YgjV family protein [Marinobacter sp. 1-4A]MBK1853266.1 YgjV family protein [Marinobacter sp. 1-4A]